MFLRDGKVGTQLELLDLQKGVYQLSNHSNLCGHGRIRLKVEVQQRIAAHKKVQNATHVSASVILAERIQETNDRKVRLQCSHLQLPKVLSFVSIRENFCFTELCEYVFG